MSKHILEYPFDKTVKLQEPRDIEIKFIKSGMLHIIIVTKDNSIYVCGSNRKGQLALKNVIKSTKFEKLHFRIGQVKLLECADFSSIFVNKWNEIWIAGHDWFATQLIGKLCIEVNPNLEITEIKANNNEDKVMITDIYSSYMEFSILRTDNDVLYFSGDNYRNKLNLDLNLLKSFLGDEVYFVDKYIKLMDLNSLNSNYKFIHPIFVNGKLLFLKSNYFINNESNYLEEKRLNCYKILQNQQLIDISLLFQ
ncbi:hypothetical protein ABK040_000084 [Willaertia magna]